MLSLIAAALVASTSAATPSRPVGATARATASIRILSSASIRWGQSAPDLPKVRVTRLRGATGEPQPIRLIEFE